MVRSYVALRVDGCSSMSTPAVAQFNVTFNNVNMTALEILNIPASPVATAVRAPLHPSIPLLHSPAPPIHTEYEYIF